MYSSTNSLPKMPTLFDTPHRDDFYVIYPIKVQKVNALMKLEKVQIGSLRVECKGKVFLTESKLDPNERYQITIEDVQIEEGTLFDLYEYLPSMGTLHEAIHQLYANHIETKNAA